MDFNCHATCSPCCFRTLNVAERETCLAFLVAEADWLRGLPGIVAESLNKDLNPLPMSGLLLRKCIINENSLTDAWD